MQSVFGSVQFLSDVSPKSIQLALQSALQLSPNGIFILCCDQSYLDVDSFDQLLKNIECPVFGGVFPAIVLEQKTYEQGLFLVPVFVPLEVKLYTDLAHLQSKDLTFDVELEQYQSLLVLVDGLSRNIDYALNQIFSNYGQELQVFGGDVGSLSFTQKPYLFSNQGVVADAMLIVAIQQEFNLAIGHGWEVLAGPYLANQTDDHRIVQLNFQPALTIYKDVVEQHDGRLFDDHEFFDLAKTYPFGIERLDDDILVRDPVTFEQNSLVCVGKVPENTMLYILSGQPDNLLNAVTVAVENNLTTTANKQGLVFDCISRKLFLDEQFSDELHNISVAMGSGASLFGALVLGEIASGQSGSISFHNKTAVVAIT